MPRLRQPRSRPVAVGRTGRAPLHISDPAVIAAMQQKGLREPWLSFGVCKSTWHKWQKHLEARGIAVVRRPQGRPRGQLVDGQALSRRLESRIADGPGACRTWVGTVSSTGYGEVMAGGKHFAVHRLMWGFERGDIPHGLVVGHTCGNKRCCNVEHMFLGTKTQVNRLTARNRRGARKTQPPRKNTAHLSGAIAWLASRRSYPPQSGVEESFPQKDPIMTTGDQT